MDKQVYAFGSGTHGECGHGDFANASTPALVRLPEKKTTPGYEVPKAPPSPIDIAAGGKHSLILAANGSLFSFGFNGQGQLGQRHTNNLKSPTLVEDFDNVRIAAVSAGAHHTIAQTNAGDLYACGLNKDGQLGLGHHRSRISFTHITCFAGIQVQRFSAAGNHSWFQIDEYIPFRHNYAMPKPLVPPKPAQKPALEKQQTERTTSQPQKAARSQSPTPIQQVAK